MGRLDLYVTAEIHDRGRVPRLARAGASRPPRPRLCGSYVAHLNSMPIDRNKRISTLCGARSGTWRPPAELAWSSE